MSKDKKKVRDRKNNKRLAPTIIGWMANKLGLSSTDADYICQAIAAHYGVNLDGHSVGARINAAASLVRSREKDYPSTSVRIRRIKPSAATHHPRQKTPPNTYTMSPSQADIDAFYESWDWKRLRYDFIKHKDRRCGCCGRTPQHGIVIHVDHIKPIRRYWVMRLDITNLQILCEDCNQGKGSRDETDWREPSEDSRLSAIREQLRPRQ